MTLKCVSSFFFEEFAFSLARDMQWGHIFSLFIHIKDVFQPLLIIFLNANLTNNYNINLLIA